MTSDLAARLAASLAALDVTHKGGSGLELDVWLGMSVHETAGCSLEPQWTPARGMDSVSTEAGCQLLATSFPPLQPGPKISSRCSQLSVTADLDDLHTSCKRWP